MSFIEQIGRQFKEFSIGILILVGLITAIYASFFGFLWITETGVCEKYADIIAVGGCSAFGKCGVQLADKSFSRANFPVIGSKTCVIRSYTRLDRESWPFAFIFSKNGNSEKNGDKSNIVNECRKGSDLACEIFALSASIAGADEVAFPFFERLCAKGNADACEQIGRIEFHRGNFKKAKVDLTDQCKNGSESICITLASAEAGLGQKKSSIVRLEEFHKKNESEKKCLKLGMFSACYNLACYNSLIEDIDQSLFFLMRAMKIENTEDNWSEAGRDKDLVFLWKHVDREKLKKDVLLVH